MSPVIAATLSPVKVWALIDERSLNPLEVYLTRESAEADLKAVRADAWHPEDRQLAHSLSVRFVELVRPYIAPGW